jgi:hypothetical protein
VIAYVDSTASEVVQDPCFVLSGILSPILWSRFGKDIVIGKTDRSKAAAGTALGRRAASH